MITELFKDNFKKIVTEHDFVIIDHWSPQCGPCLSFAPVFEKVAEGSPEILFANVNTAEQREIAKELNIQSVPTVMIVRDQVVLFNQPGALTEGAFREVVRKAIELNMDDVQRQVEGAK